jgi:hypothetical protein
MSWLLVPLQYLFLIWRAQTYTAKAAAAAGTRKHEKYLLKATEATLSAEVLQRRFPEVTNSIDIRRNQEALRFELRK